MSSAPSARAEPPATTASPPRRFGSLSLAALVTLPLVLLDQWSKSYVQSHMALYENITIIPNYFDITYATNSGAAFSMFTGLPQWFRMGFLGTLAAIAIVVLLILMARNAISLTTFAYALILAGASGNLLDRIVRGGRVIDFVRWHYYDLNWPIFNVADSAISVGVTLLILTMVFGSSEKNASAA